MDTQNLDGLGNLDDLVKRVANVESAFSELEAPEAFVLSRLDTAIPLSLVFSLTGLSKSENVQVLKSLLAKKLITIGNADASPTSQPPSESSPKHDMSANPWDEQLDAEDAAGVITISRDVRIRWRELHGKLAELSFFELLGVRVTADKKAIRRAYFSLSKEFHPDRYYTKKLGVYKEYLAEIFRQMSAAYEFLQDESKRMEYAALLQQSSREPVVDSVSTPVFEPRRRTSDVAGLLRRNLRGRLSRNVPEKKEQAQVPIAEVITADDDEAISRRQKDRERASHYRRRRTFSRSNEAKEGRAKRLYEQGMSQFEKQEYVAAAASLKLAASYHPDNVDYQRSFVLASEKAGSINGENFFKRAIFEESVGRIETAANFFQKAADASPQAEYLKKAAERTLDVGDLVRATEYATKATQKDPNNMEVRLVSARVFLASGMKKNAQREINAALKLDSTNAMARSLAKEIRKMKL